MPKDKPVKANSTAHSRSTSKRSLELGKLNLPLKAKGSSKCIPRLSAAIELLYGFEALAQGTNIPGISCPFRILIKILTIIKNMKENTEDAQYLSVLSEKHLGVALDTAWQNDNPPSSFANIFNYFIDTLLEIKEFMSQIINRTPTAALRLALSDKQQIQDLTQKLNDSLLLFLNSSVSEAEARRSRFEQQQKEEMAVVFDRLEMKMNEIMSRLDEFPQRQPLEQTRSPVTQIFDYSFTFKAFFEAQHR